MRALTLSLSLTLLIVITFCDGQINLKCGSKVAFTINGEKCLNDCVDGKCAVDETNLLYYCNKTDVDTFVHRTIRGEKCHSCCVEKSLNSGRCVIKNGTWDYCDASTTVKWVRDVRYTANNGPCIDACRHTDGNQNSSPKCHHYWLGTDTCNLELGFNYIQAKTITGDMCKGACKKHRGREYTWCAYGARNEKACVLPGMPPMKDWTTIISSLLTTRETFCVVDEDVHGCEGKSSRATDPRKKLLEKLAQEIEYEPDYKTVFVHSNINPVYSYTIEEGEVIKPKIVRAVIRPSHLFSDENTLPLSESVKQNLDKLGKESNDILGYLVGYFLGGPQTTYNVINVKPLSYNENTKIVEFLNKNKHQLDAKVELLVVVLYPKDKTRPKGVVRQVKLYHSKCLVKDYYEYIPILDANDEREMLPNATRSIRAPWWLAIESLLPPVNYDNLNTDNC